MLIRRHAVALVAVLMLAGCSSEELPPVVDPTPTGPSSQASTAPSASATPEPSKEPESAEAFVKRWFSEYGEMQTSGQGGRFLSLSSKCGPCKATAKRFESIYGAGGWIRGGMINVRSVELVTKDGQSQTWVAHIEVTPTRFRESASSQLQTLDGGSSAVRFTLLRVHSSFVVTEYFRDMTK